METRKFKEKCEMVFDYFDSPDDMIMFDRPGLVNFLGELFDKEWDRIETIVEKADLCDEAVEFYSERSNSTPQACWETDSHRG